MEDTKIIFAARTSVAQVEEGTQLAPKFDEHGLIPVVTTDHDSGEVLMHAYMNPLALQKTIETGEAHYWSRSRQKLWRKGETSGLVQRVAQLLIDDDQDCVWMRVRITGGASCHVGYRSCFYRAIPVGEKAAAAPTSGASGGGGGLTLTFTEKEKAFDPQKVYGNAPNPTKL